MEQIVHDNNKKIIMESDLLAALEEIGFEEIGETLKKNMHSKIESEISLPGKI